MSVQNAPFEAPQRPETAASTLSNEGANLSSPASRSAYAAMTVNNPDAANAHYGSLTIDGNGKTGYASAPINTKYVDKMPATAAEYTKSLKASGVSPSAAQQITDLAYGRSHK